MLTPVILHGHLAEKYGSRFDLAAESVAEAISLLRASFSTFADDVIGHEYHIWVGESNIGSDELANPVQGQEIHIIPVIRGAGGNASVWQIVLGIVLVVVGVLTAEFGGGFLVEVGIGLIIGGVISMIFAPSARSLTFAGLERGASKASYRFSGALNVSRQGNPVPVLYGRAVIGSQVIATSISSKDLV